MIVKVRLAWAISTMNYEVIIVTCNFLELVVCIPKVSLSLCLRLPPGRSVNRMFQVQSK